MHSLVWDEAQKLSGKDPDFHRRDLFEAIERGDFPEWELGLQVVEEKDEHAFDFDLLDPTKIIPEELVPVRRVGRLTLNRNPDNYFAETEQVAFHTGHVVPGIDFTNDPLLQGRLFSYIDTQLRRVGPELRRAADQPAAAVRCTTTSATAWPGRRSTRAGWRTSPTGWATAARCTRPRRWQAFTSYAEKVEGAKIRARSESFNDHFSQATLFWNSMADWEKAHIAEAFAFELNQVESEVVRHHVVNELLVNIADPLARAVSAQTGIPVAPVGTQAEPDAVGADPVGAAAGGREGSPIARAEPGQARRHDQGAPDRHPRRGGRGRQAAEGGQGRR